MTRPIRPRVVMVSRRLRRKNKVVDWVSEAHLSVLMKEGLLPVIVPVVPETLRTLELYARDMAGLLLAEGGDIHPSYYGEKGPLEGLEELDPVKDKIEFWLCRRALRGGIPVLGICRGMQVLNVLRGGTLYRDVMAEKKSGLKHVADEAHYDAYRHRVRVLPGTPLFAWYRRKTLLVNSYHHQGVKKLAPDHRPMAVSDDGHVEAFYDPARAFCVGLQFHPERMMPEYAGNLRVFKAFSRAVKSFPKA